MNGYAGGWGVHSLQATLQMPIGQGKQQSSIAYNHRGHHKKIPKFVYSFFYGTNSKETSGNKSLYIPFYQWTIDSISSSFLMQVFSRRDVPECSLETVSLWRLSAWPEQRFPWHTCTATHKMKLDSLKTYRLPRGNLIIISKFIRTTQLNFSLLTRVKKGCSHCRINYWRKQKLITLGKWSLKQPPVMLHMAKKKGRGHVHLHTTCHVLWILFVVRKDPHSIHPSHSKWMPQSGILTDLELAFVTGKQREGFQVLQRIVLKVWKDG